MRCHKIASGIIFCKQSMDSFFAYVYQFSDTTFIGLFDVTRTKVAIDRYPISRE